MTEHNNGRLAQVVFSMSRGNDWDSVSREWVLDRIEYIPLDEQETARYHCVCGHVIAECCYVRHRETGEELLIGNDCVKFFTMPEFQIPAKAWSSLRKLVANTEGVTMNTAL